MYSKIAALAALVAFAEARFGQEGAVQNVISALGNFGNPGQAATLAGASPGVLLGGANACAKLELADEIVATLGNDPEVIAAAAALVAAEKNFNPFASSIPTICSDASLPATPELRGIVPAVDPAVAGSDVENANAATSITTPFNADGLSQADVAIANGFTNFTSQGSDGSTAAPAGGNAGGDAGNGAGNGNNGNGNNGNGNNGNGNNGNGNNGNGNNGNGNNGNGNAGCGAVRTLTTVIAAPTQGADAGNGKNGNGNGNGNNGNNGNGNNGNGNNGNNGNGNGNGNGNNGNGNNGNGNNGNGNNGNGNNGNNGNGNGNNGNGNNAAADFGSCDPTIQFTGGLGGRPATEFTFQSNDPQIAANQQEALNPNIITNRICDELTNICGANQAAKDICEDAQAQIQALGTRDATTADAWNALVGV